MDLLAYYALNYSHAVAEALGDLAGVPAGNVRELGARPLVIEGGRRLRHRTSRKLAQAASASEVHSLAGVAGRWWVVTGQPGALAGRLGQPELLARALMRHGVVEVASVQASKAYGSDQDVACE